MKLKFTNPITSLCCVSFLRVQHCCCCVSLSNLYRRATFIEQTTGDCVVDTYAKRQQNDRWLPRVQELVSAGQLFGCCEKESSKPDTYLANGDDSTSYISKMSRCSRTFAYSGSVASKKPCPLWTIPSVCISSLVFFFVTSTSFFSKFLYKLFLVVFSLLRYSLFDFFGVFFGIFHSKNDKSLHGLGVPFYFTFFSTKLLIFYFCRYLIWFKKKETISLTSTRSHCTSIHSNNTTASSKKRKATTDEEMMNVKLVFCVFKTSSRFYFFNFNFNLNFRGQKVCLGPVARPGPGVFEVDSQSELNNICDAPHWN